MLVYRVAIVARYENGEANGNTSSRPDEGDEGAEEGPGPARAAATRRRVAEQVARLSAADERDAMDWIETAEDFFRRRAARATGRGRELLDRAGTELPKSGDELQ